MSLKEILNQLRERKVESEMVLEAVEPKYRPGVEGTIRSAKDEMVRLTNLYKAEAVRNTVLIGVRGPGAAKFAEIAQESFKTVSINYKEIAVRITKSLRERRAQDTYSQHEHYLLLTELNNTKAQYGIAFLPPPSFTFNDGSFGQPLEIAIERVISANYNNTLYSIVTKKDIGDYALKAEFAGKTLPVVLYNYTDVDAAHLQEPLTVVDADENIDTEFVKTVLNGVRNRLKKAKSSKSLEDENLIEGE